MIRRNSVVTTFADEVATTLTVSYAPATTIRGIVVGIITPTHSGDNISSVTFGGNALTRIAEAHDATGDAGSSYIYHDGTSLAAGTNNVVITVTGGSISLRGAIGSIIADGDTRPIAFGSAQEDNWNPRINLFAGPKPAIVFGNTFSGLSDVTSLTELTGQTRTQSDDFGAHVSVSTVRTSPETYWFQIGWTGTIDSTAFTAAAFVETEPTPPAFTGGGGGGFAPDAALPDADLPSGVVTPTGSGASTLEDVTSAGSGSVNFQATGASTLEDVTSAGTGIVANPVTGTGASTLDDVTSAGSGSLNITGTGASTLDGVTSSGSGEVGFPATGSSTLDGVTSTGIGSVANPVSGTGASTLDGVTSTGTGALTITGTGASTLDAVTSSGSGIVANPVTGTGASTLDDVTSDGQGIVAAPGAVVGMGASTLTGVTSAGSGIISNPSPGGGAPVRRHPEDPHRVTGSVTRRHGRRVGGRPSRRASR